MKRFLMGAVVATSVAGGSVAQAQWGFPFFVQPYPYFVEHTEVWRDVHYAGTIAWELDGHSYCLGPAGYQCDGEAAVCNSRFVEPFDCWGQRVVKNVSLPVGTEYTRQEGIKTIAYVGGRAHFATWILTADNRIQQVWVRIEEQVESEPPMAAPAPEYSPPPAGIPQRSTPPALPVPEPPEQKA